MKKLSFRVLVAVSLAAAACSSPASYRQTTGGEAIAVGKGATHRFTFDDANSVASAFEPILGNWQVEQDPSAPSAPALMRQVETLGNPDFPRTVLRQLTFTNARVKVRCRMERGGTDQACGLMFRFQDSDNYYITRANALEGNVRLYRVVGGTRESLAGRDLPVPSGEWHTLEAVAQATNLRVLWDGNEVIAASDDRFGTGKVGLWTKADSITAFDDLEVSEL